MTYIFMSQISTCSARALFLAAAAWSVPVAAQSVGEDPNIDNQQEEIVITGSRIARDGFRAPTPVTSLGSVDLENAVISNVGQLASQVPSFQAVVTPATTTLQSQYPGAAILNLRNLGNVRTLVLVNGRRFVPTTTSGTIDTNVIPSALIERVDVVTAGASSVYGSDAVAGVINLVLKRNLNGIVGDVQAGISGQGDNSTYKGALAWGSAFAGGAGHITLAAEGEINKGVLSQAGRSWASRGYGIITNPGYTPTNGQSRQLILPDFQLATASLGGLITTGPLRGTDFGFDGVPRPFTYGQYAGSYQIGGSGTQGSDYIALTVPYDRYSLYAMAEYDIGGVDAFVEVSHASSKGEGNITPIFHLGNITIQPDNAYLPSSLASQVVGSFNMGRYSPDMGYIRTNGKNTTDRVVVGLNGGISRDWSWSAYGQYGHNSYRSLITNNLIPARFARSVDAVNTGSGVACRVNANASTADDDPACFPVNLFGVGSPDQRAIDYFTGTARYKVSLDQWVVAGNVRGSLFPIGGRMVKAAAGAEYRSEEVRGVSDALSQNNGFMLGNPKAMAGKYDVVEAFGEVAIPLLSDLPLIHSLDLDGAVRVTDYSTSGTVATWKLGANWQVVDDLRLRLTRSRDIRAPNFDELFTNSLFRAIGVNDPASGSQVTAMLTTNGNPDLKPEIGNTFTGGIVFTPSFLAGFKASVDYFDITLKGAIGQLMPQDIVNRCHAGNTEFCSFVTRNTAGTLTGIRATQINLSKISTRGLDFEMAYRVQLGGAHNSLMVRGLATYVDSFSTDDGLTKVDRVNDIGWHNGLPHWKFNLTVTYQDGPFTLNVQNRFVGGGKYDVTFGENQINDNSIPGRNYVDLSLRYAVVETERQRFEVFFNVRNLLDQDPPIVPNNFQSPIQTNPQLYDVIGRQFTTGIRFKY